MNPSLAIERPMNLKKKRRRYAYLETWYSYGSLLFIHTKKAKTYQVWRHKDVIIIDCAQIADLQWNIGRIEFSAKKISKYRNFARFFAYNKGNDVSSINYKIQNHTVKIYFKTVICNMPVISNTAYPTPGKVVPRTFLIKLTTKDVKEIFQMS